MDGIDEADQMPVEAAPEDSDPLCYICSWYVGDFECDPRLKPGVYYGSGMMKDRRFWQNCAWKRYFRMSK